MRSSAIASIRMPFLIVLLFAVNLPYANPVAPMPITKVHYLDSLHWTIGFRIRELGIYYSKMPDQTDTITLGCRAGNLSADIPMQQCAIPIKLNPDSGSGCIAPQNFPGLKLKPGWVIFIGVKNGSHPEQELTLPNNLKPNETLTLTERYTTCFEHMIDTLFSYTCLVREYIATESSECPPYARGNGRISGTLTNMYKAPLSSFIVQCFADLKKPPVTSTQTTANGSFMLEGLDLCPLHVLQFRQGSYQADYMIEPLSVMQQKAVNLSIQIQYPPTDINERQTLPAERSPSVRLLASSGNNGDPIVFVVSENSLRGKGTCELYTLNGKMIRSLPFTCWGIGTYTVAWDGADSKDRPMPAATYLCRVKIGQELMCRSFIKR